MPQPDQDTVTLTPVMNGNGTVNHWTMSLNKGGPLGPGSYPLVHVPQGHNAVVTFTIQNGPNITFANILVPAESKEIHSVGGLGTATLTVSDHNWNKGDIPYAILFNGAPKLDPIMQNDGGGPSLYSNVLLDAVGLAIAAAVVFFLLRPMFRRRAVERPSEDR
jgi:hypothetical protein